MKQNVKASFYCKETPILGYQGHSLLAGWFTALVLHL